MMNEPYDFHEEYISDTEVSSGTRDIPRLYYTWAHQNKFTEARIGEDWNMKVDWGKINTLSFSSPTDFKEGTHVKLINPSALDFGGQIVKKEMGIVDGWFKYEAYDYKRYLLTQSSSEFVNATTSGVLKIISSQVSPPIEWKISNTKTVFPRLEWESATILDIICDCCQLEFENKNLIYFDVDKDAYVTYKPYPQTIKGYNINQGYDYTHETDFSDIATGYGYYENWKLIDSYSNKDMTKIWGNIRIVSNVKPQSASATMYMGCKDDIPDQEELDGSVDNVVVGVCDYVHPFAGGDASEEYVNREIFQRLKSAGIPARLYEYYYEGLLRYYVEYYDRTSWVVFDYKNLHNYYHPSYTKDSRKLVDEYIPQTLIGVI